MDSRISISTSELLPCLQPLVPPVNAHKFPMVSSSDQPPPPPAFSPFLLLSSFMNPKNPNISKFITVFNLTSPSPSIFPATAALAVTTQLLAIILPIVGIGIFLWWAGRDIVQSTCPNCGNPFQVFKSTLQDEVQLCPYCSQPFSVEGNEFVKEPIQFSKRSSPFGQPFDDFLTQSRTGKKASKSVVDVEAEVKDAE